MNEFLSELLKYYDLSLKEYDKLTKSPSNSLFDFVKSNEYFLSAKKVVEESIKNNEKILIFGDYDCDGILGTSIIYNSLKKKGYTPGFYIPFRESDGYGMSLEKAKYFESLGYTTFILVDNGITLFEVSEYIKSKDNLKLVIIDHHLIDETKTLKYDALIHWKYINEFNDTNISAGALAFLFSVAFLDEIDPYLLVLGGITIISDLMPMIGFNREMVQLVLKELNKENNNFDNIRYLMRVNRLEDVNEDDVALFLVPKVNSIGRIINDNSLFNIVKYFNLDSIEKHDKIRVWIESVNENRKQLLTDIDETSFVDFELKDHCLFCLTTLKEGMIGLLANRLVEKYQKTAFVISINEESEIYKGSVRSLKGVNAVEKLRLCSEFLVNFGGHESAAGFSLNKVNYNSFKNRISEVCDIEKGEEKEELEKAIYIRIKDINYDNYEYIESLRPFGKGFEYPRLVLKHIPTHSLTLSKTKEHIVSKVGFDSFLVYFNYPLDLLEQDSVNFYGKIVKNVFRNQVSFQFKIYHFEIDE